MRVMNNIDFCKLTSAILTENPEWEDVYARYAEEILANKAKYASNSLKFQVKSPLLVYSSIGKVMTDDSTTKYDIRFAGQSIATVSVRKDGEVLLNANKEQAKRAHDKFGFENSVKIKNEKWNGTSSAVDFRRFFSNMKNSKELQVKSQEHRIESFLLKEFSESSRDKKLLCNIQPVRLGGKFFQLTTPLKASTHNPKLSMDKNRKGATGGGIDILSRVKHSATISRYAVMELKDENVKNESQEDAMHQAITYATFMAFLFRSESGKKWWNILRPEAYSEKSVPEHIDLDVVTIMPNEGASRESEMDDIEVEDKNTTLHLYTLYYKTDNEGNPISFSGSLTEAIMK